MQFSASQMALGYAKTVSFSFKKIKKCFLMKKDTKKMRLFCCLPLE
jgi:hypothetical protein